MFQRLILPLLLALSLGLPLAARAVDEADLLPIDEAFALSAEATDRGRIEFRWKIAEGYYLYRHRMAVLPLDGGFKANPLELPPGKAYTDEFFGDVETYRGEVVAVQTGAAADGVATLRFEVRYQGCADLGICYPPHKQVVEVTLPAATASTPTLPGGPLAALPIGGGKPLLGAQPVDATVEGLPLPEEEAFSFEAIATQPSVVLMRFTPAPGYYLYRDRSSFRFVDGDDVVALAPQWPPAQSHFDEHFGDVAVYFEQVEVPLPLQRSAGAARSVTLEATFQGCQTDGICYPPMTRRVDVALPASSGSDAPPSRPAPASAELGLIAALLLALGGGLLLNLMPCVLPVLSLKALGLANSGESQSKARAHALWYTFGVLASFAALGALALALRGAGLALGWGFQLQQPAVVTGLAFLMAAIGFNLSGVFEIGTRLAGVGQSLTEKSGPAGDFFTGVLAVVVASPCTAPFMGAALAFAFAAHPAVAIAVFLALGLGLALPFLLIGFIPALAARLPRPGAWMQTFREALAFPMYLTAIWLLWVLGKQRGVDALGLALVGLAVFAAGLWLWGRNAQRPGRVKAIIAVVLLALGLYSIVAVGRVEPAPTPSAATEAAAGESIAYSADRLAALRKDGRAVFVNMTADWCVTCKANERRVLSGDAFRDALAAAGAVYMKGDWTNVDPAITAFLESHGAVGVPLYVVYPAGGGDGEVLPTVLTDAIVGEALQRARGG